MSTAVDLAPAETVGDLLARLEGIEPHRILLRPAPGTATEADLLHVLDHGNRLCELVEATLVEKGMGTREGSLAGRIFYLLQVYLDGNDIGELFGADSPFRLEPGLVRMPDVTFILRENLADGQIPSEAIAGAVPDLAVEVLSESNTPAEMRRKRRDYFTAGTTLVWEVDPQRRVVVVYTDAEMGVTLTEADTLDGGNVLPGLVLPIRRIFERLPPLEVPARGRGRKKPKG